MQTQTAAEISKELDQTDRRLSELEKMREKVNSRLEDFQARFIERKIPIDELQTEQSRLTTLNSSIEALEAKRSKLEAVFESISESDRKRAALQNLTTKAIDTASSLNSYLDLYSEFGSAVQDMSEKLLDALQTYRSNQNEYKDFRASIDQNEIELCPVGDEELRLAQVQAELQEKGLTGNVLKWATLETLPAGEFSSIIHMCINLAINKREIEAHQKRRAAA
jgi:chromosome segregation ATPase